jgi:hypothetical protein
MVQQPITITDAKAEEELQSCKEPKIFESPFAYLPAACNLVDAIRLAICKKKGFVFTM